MEKSPVYVGEPNEDEKHIHDDSPPIEQHTDKAGVRDVTREGEAVDVYGDVATAEEYGYVSRG